MLSLYYFNSTLIYSPLTESKEKKTPCINTDTYETIPRHSQLIELAHVLVVGMTESLLLDGLSCCWMFCRQETEACPLLASERECVWCDDVEVAAVRCAELPRMRTHMFNCQF